MIKIVSSNGEEVRKRLFEGVNKAGDLARLTLGPSGRNVAIQTLGNWPLITNDGISILRKIELEDEIENEGALYLANAAARTSEIAGDGTTTTAVLAQKIINFYVTSKIPENQAPATRKAIHEWKEKVLELIDKKSKKVKTQKELYAVAFAAGEDKELAEEVSKMAWKIGADGFISVDDSGFTETSYEVIDGMRIKGKVHFTYTITDHAKVEATLLKQGVAHVPLIITNYDFVNGTEIFERSSSDEGIVKRLMRAGYKQLAILAPKFHENSGKLFMKIAQDSGFMIVPIKVPALTSDEFEDIAVYTGGKFVDNRTNDSVASLEIPRLGFCENITANPFHAMLTGGQGDKEKVKARIAEIREKIKSEQILRMRKKMERRISSLAGGVGVITVGAETDIERKDKKLKIQNAVNSTLAALDEGVVRGGGVTLKEIAEELEPNILTEALKAPYEQIQENAGGNLEIC